ncbi:hypothetical protein [Streptomyces sp. MJP52]|uniref:hypothetical protein n=1 Tax=Streptomyces sp. MJP52 TaxID=2940555 RepID=UPI0024736AAE|nr:hypothetical protein [Streptomyces sp. MJP52]MDH6228084.1 hypothetical protein [Streptomyces sp. MJP52]
MPSWTSGRYEIALCAPSALQTSAPPGAATLPDLAAGRSTCGFAMTNRPRGAIMPIIWWVSTGRPPGRRRRR